MPPSRVKKATNPYKLSYNVGALNSKQGFNNKITTVKVAADNVFVSWSTRPGGKNVSSYLKPYKDYFNLHCNENDGLLMNDWKISGFLTRRKYDEDYPMENEKLTGSPDAAWLWEAIITIVPPNNGDTPVTAASVGKHIASTFTNFDDDKTNRSKASFVYHRDASEAQPAPLSRYIVDDDVVQVIKLMYANLHKKEDVLGNDELLKSFFGVADRGRSLLEYEEWGPQDDN